MARKIVKAIDSQAVDMDSIFHHFARSSDCERLCKSFDKAIIGI
jgi:hypothetical protein